MIPVYPVHLFSKVFVRMSGHFRVRITSQMSSVLVHVLRKYEYISKAGKRPQKEHDYHYERSGKQFIKKYPGERAQQNGNDHIDPELQHEREITKYIFLVLHHNSITLNAQKVHTISKKRDLR